MIPENLKYTKDHEWVLLDGDTITMGITNHAQSELGDITFVELPDLDTEVSKGDELCTIESVKAAADVFAPINGTVCTINESLEDEPEKLNQSPYTEGWICKLNNIDTKEVSNLMDATAYQNFIDA